MLFLSHFARWLVPVGILVYVVPAPELTGCAQTLASHFRDVRVFRLGSSECARYRQIVVFGVARSRRERDRTRDSEISYGRDRLIAMARQYESLTVLGLTSVELRVPPSAPADLSYAGLPLNVIEDLLPESPAYRQIGQILDPPQIALNARPLRVLIVLKA